MPTTYAIPDGRTVMNASTWTGDGVTPKAVVSNLAFQPDFLWLKQRSAVNYHFLQNSIAGATKYLASNATDAESSGSSGGWIQSFDSTGYTTVTGSSNSNNVNGSGITYVGWAWKAGGTAVANTSGSTPSLVSANTTAGFSVVSFTSPASGSFTIGHGLNAVPNLIITKPTSRSAGWVTYHSSLNGGSPGTSYFVYLDTTAGQASLASPPMWGSAVPTSSVFGASVSATCAASEPLIAYCFAAVAGYSAFGSYTGNGSSDGPFVYLGFRPRWVMIKISAGTTGSWVILDTSRNTYNPEDNRLLANLSNAEGGGVNVIDVLSNGFKLRDTDSSWNASTYTYIYAAFAENPFKYANAR